jgi:iron donor protein CyaY
MKDLLDDATFRRLSDECLARAEAWLERFDPDEVDYAGADGVLTLELASGLRFVLNRQAGSRQMWYAAGARAWHYDWEPRSRTWRDDRDGHELFANVARTLAQELGRPVDPPG